MAKILWVIIGIAGLVLLNSDLSAQCAMCKASLENNVSSGDIGYAARLNFGILYLFVLPYLLVFILAFLWYRKSRKNKRNYLLSKKRRERFSQLGL